MPTYQYACTVASCGHAFDTVQAFSDDALTQCPECSGRLRKVWGSIGVVFKGSGFYRNDSRESAKKQRDGHSGDGNGEGKNAKKESKESSSTKASADSSSSASTTSSSDSGSSTKKPAPASTGESSASAKRSPAAAS